LLFLYGFLVSAAPLNFFFIGLAVWSSSTTRMAESRGPSGEAVAASAKVQAKIDNLEHQVQQIRKQRAGGRVDDTVRRLAKKEEEEEEKRKKSAIHLEGFQDSGESDSELDIAELEATITAHKESLQVLSCLAVGCSTSHSLTTTTTTTTTTMTVGGGQRVRGARASGRRVAVCVDAIRPSTAGQ
jgi:hypothetical protein